MESSVWKWKERSWKIRAEVEKYSWSWKLTVEVWKAIQNWIDKAGNNESYKETISAIFQSSFYFFISNSNNFPTSEKHSKLQFQRNISNFSETFQFRKKLSTFARKFSNFRLLNIPTSPSFQLPSPTTRIPLRRIITICRWIVELMHFFSSILKHLQDTEIVISLAGIRPIHFTSHFKLS